MRNIFLKSSLVIAAMGLLTNCSYEEKTIDKVLDGTTSGIILKTVDKISEEYNNDTPNTAKFEVVVEARDFKQNEYLKAVNIFVAYRDNNNPRVNGVALNDKSEKLLKTIPKSSLTQGEYGLNCTVRVTLSELISTLNLTQAFPCDAAIIRIEAEAVDGKKFSNTNSSATIGQSYFDSKFSYIANIVGGAPSDSLAGTHTIITSNMYIPGTPSCGGTVNGTITWTETGTPGLYNTTDMSFGLFESTCWNDTPAVSSTSKVKWFCGEITSQGADQYGSSWTYTIKSVVGNKMKLDFISSFGTGEGGTVTIERQGGTNWPTILQTN